MIKKIFLISLPFLLLLMPRLTFAQRNNNIVLRDTVFSEGYINQLPENIKNTVYFKVKRKDPWTKYGIEEVQEYFVNSTRFLRRRLPEKDGGELVFLELVPSDKKGYNLFRSVEDKKILYLEGPKGIERLTPDFKEVLKQIEPRPQLQPLLDITGFNVYEIAYFLSESENFQKPRTYTKPTAFGVHAGSALVANQFIIPFTNEQVTVNGTGIQAGVSWELRPTALRTIGFSAGLNFTKVTSQEFLKFQDQNTRFEVDAFLDYSVIQLPVLARYYLDIRPQSLRAYAELGYGLSFIQSTPYSLEVAQLEGNQIFTYRRAAEISGNFYGVFGGIGVEKILPKSHSVFLGIKFSSQQTANKEQLQLTTGVIGFRF